MKLITQPDEGIKPLLAAVKRAKRRITIVIFRFDLDELEEALAAAVKRGVEVVALIAHTNKGGEQSLRKLEQRMLKKGVTVNRTDDDMVRYHGKVLVIDRRAAFILGFNYTGQDVESRSFGVVSRSPRIVKELLRLFESDSNRTDYTPRVGDLVVSPESARSRLYRFLRKTQTTLDIYDPNVADDEMLALLEKKAARGVRIRIIGCLEKKWEKLGFAEVQKLRGRRLHVRAMVRDGRRAFIGSQSLRKLELDERREVGIIIRDRKIVRKVEKVFNADWKRAVRGKKSR
jgi:phosphatidylserine/phosphatidylglycerophosphate/cardiolipin synthase-like enzyme